MATNSLPHTSEDETKLALLERLADRFADEPDSMAYRMAHLGITPADLGIDRRQAVHLRLCLLPRPDSLEADIQTIAKAADIPTDTVRKAAGL